MARLPSVIHHPGLPPADYVRSIDPLAGDPYLVATAFLDFDHPSVQRFVEQASASARTQRERAVAIFYAVRDRIRYDPYDLRFGDEAYQASAIIESGHGWCVSKAGLLAACARSIGVPSAIGLADVVNHLNTEKLRRRMGGVDVFYDHGYAALFIEGRWLKAAPAFNIELCERFGVRPTEFDGTADALYQEFDMSNRRHMEYLADHGTWSDMPLQQVREDFARHYPRTIGRLTGLIAGEQFVAQDDGEKFEDGKRVA